MKFLIMRLFVLICLQLSAYGAAFETTNQEVEQADTVNVALLHIAPILGDLEANTQLVAKAMAVAKAEGADWVLTPELVLTGYKFADAIGTDWFVQGPDEYVKALQRVADDLNMVLFLSHLEKDVQTELVYNTLFVIERDGQITARHRKINTIPIAEAWSAAGERVTIAQVDGLRLGLLICADAWPAEHTEHLVSLNADIILSSATWPPGRYGPGRTWEQRSAESEIPFIVNNRTGIEGDFDMRQGQSVVADAGRRLVEFQSTDDSILLLSWDVAGRALISQRVLPL